MALIAHFKFDGNTVDRVGTYSSNTATSITYTTSGKIDGAAIFNGSSSALTLSSTINIPSSANWTVSVWVKFTSTASMSIFSNSSGGPVGNDLRVESGRMMYWHYNGAWFIKQGNVVFNDGNWHHLAWVNFSNNKMNMYVDGVLDQNQIDSTQSGPGAVNQIGKNWTTNYFNGTMDDFRLYNDADLGKITSLNFNKRMVAHWPLIGNNTRDTSGNNRNASHTGRLVYTWYSHTFAAHANTEAELNAFFTPGANTTFGGTGIHATNVNFSTVTGGKPGYLPADSYSWMVEGDIIVPTTGSYSFGVDADDAADISINGVVIASWYGGHGFADDLGASHSGIISLPAGSHRFRARFEEIGGGDGIKAYWKKPGDAGFSLIPAENFSGILPAPGKIGLSATFNGTDTYLRTSTFQRVTGEEITVSAWFRQTNRTGYQQLVANRSTGGDYNWLLYFHTDDGSIQFHGTAQYKSTNIPALNQWNHVVATVNSSRVCKVYLNGALVQTVNSFEFGPSGSSFIHIGASFPGAEHFSGSMNDVRMYNYALSEYEVRELSKAKVLHYAFDDPSEEPTVNLIPNGSINSYPQIGNSHATYNVNQYNGDNYFSIGTIGSVTDNIVTLSTVGTAIHTYDVLNPQTTGGGVTAGTSYFIKKISATQFSLHAYNGSQDGSQGFTNPATGIFKVYDSIGLDQRVSINSTSFPTMWKGNAHLPNSALVKEIVPNCFNGHECIRLHTDHKTNGEIDGMAYGVNPQMETGSTYTYSFYYRAATAASVNTSVVFQVYTGTTWIYQSRTVTSQWNRFETTAVSPGNSTTYMYWFPQSRGKIDVSEIQVEKKPAATPFTTGTRNIGSTDRSGYGIHGDTDITNTPRYTTTAKIGAGAFNINGTGGAGVSGGIVTVPHSKAQINAGIDNPFTFSMWLRPSGTAIAVLIRKGGQFELYKTASNFVYRTWNPTSNDVTSAATYSANNWYHLVATHDGVSTGKLYINGVLDRTISRSGTPSSTTETLGIGAYPGREYAMDGIIDDFMFYGTELSLADVQALYQSRANLDNLGNVQIDEIDNTRSYFPTLPDYSTWTIGQTSATGWSRNGTTAENIIIARDNPVGQDDIVWATLGNDATSDDDGGFNGSSVPVDKTKKYRFSVWIKRENIGNGRTYFGCGWNTVSNLGAGEVLNGNPYFTNYISSEKSNIGEQWVLIIAHVHPTGYTGGTDTVSGFYDINGNKISSISTDYKWLTTTTTSLTRAYLFYSTSTTERQYFYRPRIDLLDGNEPSLQDLINCSDNPILLGKTIADINKKALFNSNGQALFRDIDEVTGTQNTGAQQEINNNGTLFINGEFSEVD